MPPKPSATPQFPQQFASVQCPWATSFNDELFRKPPHRYPAVPGVPQGAPGAGTERPSEPVISARDVMTGAPSAQNAAPLSGKRHYEIPGTSEVRCRGSAANATYVYAGVGLAPSGPAQHSLPPHWALPRAGNRHALRCCES